MVPTYSFSEIKKLIRSFDAEETNILNDVVNEEFSCYPVWESKAIYKLIALRKKAINHNELKVEYLLAYN